LACTAGTITGLQVSPANVVFATLEKVFGMGNVLPVPLPSRIPAHASFTKFLLTTLLFPVEVELQLPSR
jgi:hypothetical protein